MLSKPLRYWVLVSQRVAGIILWWFLSINFNTLVFRAGSVPFASLVSSKGSLNNNDGNGYENVT